MKAKCDRALAQTKSKTKFGAGDTLKQALLPGNTKANTDCQPIGSSLVTCKQCLNSATNKPGIAPACVFDKNQYKCIANHLHEMFDDFEFATKTEDCPTVFKLNDKMYRDSQTTEKKTRSSCLVAAVDEMKGQDRWDSEVIMKSHMYNLKMFHQCVDVTPGRDITTDEKKKFIQTVLRSHPTRGFIYTVSEDFELCIGELSQCDYHSLVSGGSGVLAAGQVLLRIPPKYRRFMMHADLTETKQYMLDHGSPEEVAEKHIQSLRENFNAYDLSQDEDALCTKPYEESMNSKLIREDPELLYATDGSVTEVKWRVEVDLGSGHYRPHAEKGKWGSPLAYAIAVFKHMGFPNAMATEDDMKHKLF